MVCTRRVREVYPAFEVFWPLFRTAEAWKGRDSPQYGDSGEAVRRYMHRELL